MTGSVQRVTSLHLTPTQYPPLSHQPSSLDPWTYFIWYLSSAPSLLCSLLHLLMFCLLLKMMIQVHGQYLSIPLSRLSSTCSSLSTQITDHLTSSVKPSIDSTFSLWIHSCSLVTLLLNLTSKTFSTSYGLTHGLTALSKVDVENRFPFTINDHNNLHFVTFLSHVAKRTSLLVHTGLLYKFKWSANNPHGL